MLENKPSPKQATSDARTNDRAGEPKLVTITLTENDFRLIQSCIQIAQLHKPALLTWHQDIRASGISQTITSAYPLSDRDRRGI